MAYGIYRPSVRCVGIGLAVLLCGCAVAPDVPDFSGVWTNASLTGLTRPEHLPDLVIDPAEVAALERGNFHNVRAAEDRTLSDPDKSAPEVLERLPPVGNYNAYWVEPGTHYGVVNGEVRSSWIVDPADGQIPFTEPARAAEEARRAVRTGMAGPEVFSPGERCLLGFGGSSGPPMLNVLYNNYYRLLQTPDDLLILTEMVHDARVVRIGGTHGPAGDLRWLGDSVGRLEGDVLVVSTTHFHPERENAGPLPVSSDGVVEERFSLVDDDTLHYGFVVTDPDFYTQPVRGEMTFRRRDEQVFEYACHEGNYALPAMLRGARLLEREQGGGG